MGTDLHYRPGSFYRVCDRTGFAERAGRTKMQWNNIIVWDRVYEARQPQDFVKGIPDDQTVPLPRPRQPATYVNISGAQFQVYGDSPLGVTFLVMNNNNFGYDPGINTDYTNPNGGAQFQVFNGTIGAVTADSLPPTIT